MKKLVWLLPILLALWACDAESAAGFRLIAAPPAKGRAVKPPSAVSTAPVLASPSPQVPAQPTSPPLLSEGYRKLQLGDFRGAIEAFTKHIEQEGGASLAYLGRGHARAGEGSVEAAIADYTEALKSDPNLVDAYRGRGSALLEAGRLEEALSDFGEFVRMRPADPNGYRQLAWVFLLLEQPDRATREIERASAIEGERAVNFYLLGLAQRQQSNFDAAVASQSKALELGRSERLGDGFVVGVLSARGDSLHELEDYAAAFDDFTRALQIGGPNVALYERRAMVYYSQKRYTESAADIARAIEIEPENARLHNNLADSRMLEGKLEQAFTEIEAALRLEPDLGIAHYTKGEILEKMGRMDESRQSFARAAELGFVPNPEQPAD